MTPEFANKLAAACVKYGMKMKGQPEKIDVSEFADQLTPEQKADIDKYNAGEKALYGQVQPESSHRQRLCCSRY